jgi:galactokinase
VLVGLIIKDNYQFHDLTMIDIALLGQFAENNYNGANTGIMDQFASAMGKKGHAIFLDTATLEYEYAPVNLPDEKLIITNSKVKHSLVSSAYNERRSQSEEGLKILQQVLEVKTLGDITIPQFEANKMLIKDETIQKRAKHAVYENQRTIQAEASLKKGDIVTFGHLMNESHFSLRDDYQVSCQEVDYLVAQAQDMEGVLGARITGGGFGGCMVSIVKINVADRFVNELAEKYKKETGLEAEFYMADIGDGARSI